MPSYALTAAAVTIVAVALVILVGSMGYNLLSPHGRAVSLSISSAELVRLYRDRYILTLSVMNKGSEWLTVTSVALKGSGGPSCSLSNVRGSTVLKPSETVELTYVCSPVRLGEKYSVVVGTAEGASATAIVTAAG